MVRRSIEVNWLEFLFGVFTVDVVKRNASAGEKFLNEKRALLPIAAGH